MPTTNDPPVWSASELESEAAALVVATSPIAADERISADVAAFKTKLTVDGTYVAPADAERTFATRRREEYDRDLEVRLKLFERKVADSEAALVGQLAASQEPPREANALLDSVREMVARQRFDGRPLADVVHAYEADGDNPTLARLIERDLDSLRLQPDPSARGVAADVEAQERLKRAVAARRTERTDKTVEAQLDRLRKVKGDVQLSALVEYAKTGRLFVARKP